MPLTYFSRSSDEYEKQLSLFRNKIIFKDLINIFF